MFFAILDLRAILLKGNDEKEAQDQK